jgi:hypothetical protein
MPVPAQVGMLEGPADGPDLGQNAVDVLGHQPSGPEQGGAQAWLVGVDEVAQDVDGASRGRRVGGHLDSGHDLDRQTVRGRRGFRQSRDHIVIGYGNR